MPASAADRLGVAASLVLLLLTTNPPQDAAAQSSATRRVEQPLPPPRPALEGEGKPGEARPLVPPPRPADLESVPSPSVVADDHDAARAASACLDLLREQGVRFDILPPIAEGACGAGQPLRITQLSADVAVTPPATMVCAMAQAVARWSREVVVPEAKRILDARVKAIAIGTSYECRARNHRPGQKLSEHAFANAVDVGVVTLQDRSVAIGEHAAEGPESRFQAAIRQGACPLFTTVLGPGADPDHASHLHLDLRGRVNGFRICQ
jgi:hypothetical protein